MRAGSFGDEQVIGGAKVHQSPIVRARSSTDAAMQARDLAGAILVILAVTFVARLAFTIQLTEDSVTYARQILEPADDFFHPHHLLYGVAVRLLASLSGTLEVGVDPWAAVRTLQWVNLVVSALAPGLVYLIARRLAVPHLEAIGVALALGLAFRFLTFGSQVEVYNFALAALCLATLGLVLPEEHEPAPWIVALGYFLGMGFHQTALFFGGAVLVMAIGRPRPVPWLLVAFVLPGAAIGMAYLLIGLQLGHASPSALWLWLTAYAHEGSWGQGSASLGTLVDAVRGFSLVYGQGGGEAVVLVLLLATAALAVTTGWQHQPQRRRFVLAMVCFLLPLALFNAWWYGRNPEFWIMATLPVTAIVAAMLGGATTPGPTLLRSLMGLLVLAQLGVIGWQTVVTRRMEGLDAAMAEAATSVRSADLVLAIDTRTAGFLDLQMLGRDVRLEALSLVALDAGRRGVEIEPALAAAIGERVASAPAGSRVILDRSILTASSTARGLEKLDRDRLRKLLGPAADAAPAGSRFVAISPALATARWMPGR